jgi:hypothetical protein
MKAAKAFAYLLLIAPFYIILNNIFLYIFMSINSVPYREYVYGFYCNLKKNNFNHGTNLRFIEFSVMLALLHVFLFFILYVKRFDKIRELFIILFSLDLIALISYRLFCDFNVPFFRMFFSNSSFYLLSGFTTGMPMLFPFLAIAIKAFILISKYPGFVSKHSAYLFVLSLLSVLFWYTARVLYFKYS